MQILLIQEFGDNILAKACVILQSTQYIKIFIFMSTNCKKILRESRQPFNIHNSPLSKCQLMEISNIGTKLFFKYGRMCYYKGNM